jgi:hypothetical protein
MLAAHIGCLEMAIDNVPRENKRDISAFSPKVIFFIENLSVIAALDLLFHCFMVSLREQVAD